MKRIKINSLDFCQMAILESYKTNSFHLSLSKEWKDNDTMIHGMKITEDAFNKLGLSADDDYGTFHDKLCNKAKDILRQQAQIAADQEPYVTNVVKQILTQVCNDISHSNYDGVTYYRSNDTKIMTYEKVIIDKLKSRLGPHFAISFSNFDDVEITISLNKTLTKTGPN